MKFHASPLKVAKLPFLLLIFYLAHAAKSQSATVWDPYMEAPGPRVIVSENANSELNLSQEQSLFIDSLASRMRPQVWQQFLANFPKGLKSFNDLVVRCSDAKTLAETRRHQAESDEERVKLATESRPEYKALESAADAAEKKKDDLMSNNAPGWLDAASEAGKCFAAEKTMVDMALKADANYESDLSAAIKAESIAQNLQTCAKLLGDEAGREKGEASKKALIDQYAVNDAGTVDEVKVFQVIDEQSMMVEIPKTTDDYINIHTGAFGDTIRIWLSGISTRGLTDGQKISLAGPIVLINTKQYKTAIGGSSTVFVACRLDSSLIEDELIAKVASLSAATTRPIH